MDRFEIDAEKINDITRITGLSIEEVADTIDADWPNAAEHQQWLDEASAEEIADWIMSMQ